MAHHLPCRPSRPSFIRFIVCFSLCVTARAHELLPGAFSSRSPHGVAYQAPTVLSPAAFEFFHPAFSPWANSINDGDAGTAAGGAPPPIPASSVHEKVWPAATDSGGGGGRAKAGRVAGVLMLGAVSAGVLLACGVYCILRKRGTEAQKAGARCLLVA